MAPYLSATDADGKQWTMQSINEVGVKRFARNSRKEGCFHAIGGLAELAKVPAIVIGEGYSTASSLSQALGFATVAAPDSGKLPAVAKVLSKNILTSPSSSSAPMTGTWKTQGANPGRVKAEEAAKAAGGAKLFPIFAPGEQSVNPKEFTDFNDLATKSMLSIEGLERQVRFFVSSEIEKHLERREQTQEHQPSTKKQQARKAVKQAKRMEVV